MENKKVMIMGVEYSIEFVDRFHPELEGDDGLTMYHYPKIYIANDLDKERRNYVIRHEVIHGFRCQSGILDYELNGEEANVQWFAAKFKQIHKAFKELGVA